MATKTCYLCNKDLPLSSFHKRSKNPDGLDNRCMDCVNKNARRLHAIRNPPKEPDPEGFKTCTKCGELKQISEFNPRYDGTDKVYPSCRLCQQIKQTEYQKAKRAADPEGEAKKQREAQIKYKYGITPDQYEEIFESQDYKCAICGTEECASGKSFSIDHDHKTGEVRGILCMDCNVSLGKLKDDPELFRKAAEYLESFID